ncbi:hypothetical protein ALC56_00446 [Trachymyrmex septentrionalis]|uniref:Uncharacterized protein n=1 Tax=Trachymyrmex septentrionalis TaxID=34720 RepID=A0A195FXP3_9HYME|nr:hypothetical protein ALC56_00446 [Trachymyrmex septentrionalis]
MSRPILSRPRTFIYGSNYDKGESYYKPMVDHLDRKYSGRPLFPEPRNSLADEIAARRSDIGTRDLSGPRTGSLGRDPDLDLDPRTRASQPPPFTDPLLAFDDEDTVYDSRGQRIPARRRLGDDFADEVTATTRRFRARVAAIGLEDDFEAMNAAGQARRNATDLLENTVTARKSAKTAIEDVENSFKRRSKLFDEIERVDESKPAFARWSKLINEDDDLAQTSAAASRAMQTKARLHDLESEMEELAERQAKRERRAAALRALVNENAAAADADVVQQSALNVALLRSLGSRNLSGNRDDFYDELDFLLDGRGRPIQENPYEDDFVITHRRFKERAAAAFEEDMAELRRKRRDMQDRIFDVIDLNAEIEKAKSTLEAADIVFQRHATKFDNQGDDEQTMSLSQKFDRTRKIANVEKPKTFLLKLPIDEQETAQPPVPAGRQYRINSLIDTNEIGDPQEVLAMQPMKRRFLKRKKSVSF